MSFMFELYYPKPADKEREDKIISNVSAAGGHLDYRETTDEPNGSICLTFEFENEEKAELAATALRESGEHVEGVCTYE